MIQIRYFASLRERLGTDGESLPLDDSRCVGDILEHLRQRGTPWAEALAPSKTLLCAVNQEMARPETTLTDGDELAFFPPVTGG
ncbi:molybdopterin converting factor subunit 1 [Thiohalocapsa marina]|uniref:Molybdopterin synthase sulfur carrier subunit n=1 Tax=Thiohalocapsa marina TaxID=424902 RepID=A0A5M8FSS8_9GAMM|nr:molybdopterin converting factor subunit 1 [Thiohalocapsa marina]KAA6185832.1 molybdopterin converting factor subunit 1 [Thiohalocapsa marina]